MQVNSWWIICVVCLVNRFGDNIYVSTYATYFVEDFTWAFPHRVSNGMHSGALPGMLNKLSIYKQVIVSLDWEMHMMQHTVKLYKSGYNINMHRLKKGWNKRSLNHETNHGSCKWTSELTNNSAIVLCFSCPSSLCMPQRMNIHGLQVFRAEEGNAR
jgi:hypothetical protein